VTRVTKRGLAAEVWRSLLSVFYAGFPERERVLSEFGLTPGDFKVLVALSEHETRSMRELATTWACDASNVTWMVDRLEHRGLVERRTHPTDRRIKTVVLTPAGAKTRREVLARFLAPPADLFELERSDLEVLRDTLARLPHRATPFDDVT
jgi:DNA-binding MarR family transcriptional regulator